MNHRTFQLGLLILVLVVEGGYAQQDSLDHQYVPREEYENLKTQFESLKAEVDRLKKNGAPIEQPSDQAVDQKPLSMAQIAEELALVRELALASSAGSTRFLFTGYTVAGFTDREDEDSTFSANFNPIFLWKLSDRLFFEGELELELGGSGGTGETEVALEYAAVSYLLNDYVTLGAGKFLTPFGIFAERLHPAWINKLPDAPLPYSGGYRLSPINSLGFFVRGAVPVKQSKLNYAFYLTNGPALVTDDDEDAGKLDFKNFEDINNSKAIGGRVGFLPVPEVELGYSFLVARVDPDGFEQVDALLMGLDLSYVQFCEALGGIIDLRVEWIFSDVDTATYDPDGSLGFGPTTFNNRRNGGYIQIAYRPSDSFNKHLSNLELVTRWDMLEQPGGAPAAADEQRLTLGINYWLGPSTVIKTAYQYDNQGDGAEDQNALFVQGAMGF